MGGDRIGERIKAFRQEQRMSQEDLANNSGLSLELVQAIEDNQAIPALGPLVKLSRALGCRLGTFLDDEVSADPFIVRLSDRQETLALHAGTTGSQGQAYFSLGRGKTDRHMEPFFIRLDPDQGGGELSSHEGEEFIVVVSGSVRLEYGQQEHVLESGDSMYFNSVVPHRVTAAGGSTAEIYAVVYVPS